MLLRRSWIGAGVGFWALAATWVGAGAWAAPAPDARLTQYDCAPFAATGLPPDAEIARYADGALHLYDLYRGPGDQVRCLRATQPESRWLDLTGAQLFLLTRATMVATDAGPPAISREASADIVAARPMPLPHYQGDGSRPGPEPLVAAPPAYDGGADPPVARAQTKAQAPRVQSQAAIITNGDSRTRVLDTTVAPYATAGIWASPTPTAIPIAAAAPW